MPKSKRKLFGRIDFAKKYKQDPRLPSTPGKTYKNRGFSTWGKFLGTGYERRNNFYPIWQEASQAAIKLGITDLPEGAVVAIPNDPTNGGRALLLLAAQGLIQLKDTNTILATAKDVTANPKKLKFRELEAATLPRVLPQVDLALINSNFALAAKLSPTQDALFAEKVSPYANVVVARTENKDNPALVKLVNELRSAETRQFIQQKYKGAVVPAN